MSTWVVEVEISRKTYLLVDADSRDVAEDLAYERRNIIDSHEASTISREITDSYPESDTSWDMIVQSGDYFNV